MSILEIHLIPSVVPDKDITEGETLNSFEKSGLSKNSSMRLKIKELSEIISRGIPRETLEQRTIRHKAERYLGAARYYQARRKFDQALTVAVKALQLYPACLGALNLIQQLHPGRTIGKVTSKVNDESPGAFGETS